MRLVPLIGMMNHLLLTTLAAPAGAAEPGTVAEFVAVCTADAAKCDRLAAVLLQTGVQAHKLPPCVGLLNAHDITQKMLKWWAANPNQSNNKLVLGVVDALAALKPC